MPRSDASESFAKRLLSWWQTHGRRDLPWQKNRSAYRVWLAEIMLQQTQVTTVVPYFERFTARFAELRPLAEADIDEVLALWSGLGYYARARNLHATARRCIEQHGGELPRDADALAELPGIGRSTANAIVAQAFDRRAPILDGNVKRVLARHAGVEGWPGRAAVLKQLWKLAEERTPDEPARDYTQAIMDLGATVCTPRRPDCDACPVAGDCRARLQDRIGQLPGRRPPRRRPTRHALMFLMRDRRGRVLLERRPPAGIWGGLWCLPKRDLEEVPRGNPEPTMRHQFTHFELVIHLRRPDRLPPQVADDNERRWFSPAQALELGLPRPVRSILESLW